MTTLFRTLIAVVILFAAVNTTIAAPIDPIDGILSGVTLDRSAGENGIYSADLSVQYADKSYGESKPIALEFTSEMSPAMSLIDGHADVYIESVNGGMLSQGNRFYRFWYLDYTPERFAMMVAIAGQDGDQSFDNVWYDLANDCTILAVIDSANDPISPYIYTKLACNLTQYQIDNMSTIAGDSLLAMTPLYTVNVPMVMR